MSKPEKLSAHRPNHCARPYHSAGFTLIELLVAIAIVAIMATLVVTAVYSPKVIENARYAAAVHSLRNIAQAAQLYANDNDGWAPDVNRSIPSGFAKYVNPSNWAKGPWPGSVFDYDNWDDGRTCWDGSKGIIQISLRQVNSFEGKNNYVIYYVLKGLGIPHCSTSTDKGICVNCVSRYP